MPESEERVAGWKIDDAARLRTLREFGLLDTPAEDAFDRIADEAAQVCGTEVGLVSLVDLDRQWFKAKSGTDLTETPIEMAICRHTLAHGGGLVIPDTAADPRTSSNPIVTGEPFVRFYAGAPLIVDGQAIGTVCVIDMVPHPDGLSSAQQERLAELASEAAGLIERNRVSAAG